MTKHEATEKAQQYITKKEILEALKRQNGIAELEKEIKALQAELDAFTGKQTTKLFENITVSYTETNTFSQDLLKAAHPELNLDDYKAKGMRFKGVTQR